MSRPCKTGLVLLIAAGCCLTTPTTGSLACVYHGSLGDGFSALHPQSINVAIAAREAIDQGLLEQPKALPRFVAFARVGQWLDRLKQALGDTIGTEPARQNIALLLIDAPETPETESAQAFLKEGTSSQFGIVGDPRELGEALRPALTFF